MDIKCSNCGQFFDDNDKFCRYCGCPNAVAEKKIKEKSALKLSKRAIEDKIQEEKTVVVEQDIDASKEIDYSLIKVKRKGELFALRIRSIIVLAIALLFSIGGVVGAIMIKNVEGEAILKTLGIVVSITVVFFAFAVVAGRYFMIMTYSTIQEKALIVPKYGLKKTPIFMLGGFVFEMDVNIVCPICEGKIKGDLHVEKIQGRAVAVCNFNRKHMFSIGESKFFNIYLNGVEESLNINIDHNDMSDCNINACKLDDKINNVDTEQVINVDSSNITIEENANNDKENGSDSNTVAHEENAVSELACNGDSALTIQENKEDENNNIVKKKSKN